MGAVGDAPCAGVAVAAAGVVGVAAAVDEALELIREEAAVGRQLQVQCTPAETGHNTDILPCLDLGSAALLRLAGTVAVEDGAEAAADAAAVGDAEAAFRWALAAFEAGVGTLPRYLMQMTQLTALATSKALDSLGT